MCRRLSVDQTWTMLCLTYLIFFLRGKIFYPQCIDEKTEVYT